MRTAAGDATTRAAVTMRTMAPGFRHAAVIRRAAMVADRNNGVRHRRNVLRALRVLACRRAAHGEEREQTSKKETAQKNHAAWGNELTELMRIIISHGGRHDARAAMNNLYPIMAHAKALAANSYGILMLSGIVKVDFLAGGKARLLQRPCALVRLAGGGEAIPRRKQRLVDRFGRERRDRGSK